MADCVYMPTLRGTLAVAAAICLLVGCEREKGNVPQGKKAQDKTTTSTVFELRGGSEKGKKGPEAGQESAGASISGELVLGKEPGIPGKVSADALGTTSVDAVTSRDSVSSGTGVAAEPPVANALESATSPYLRSAAKSPVFWQQWSPEVFELAQRLNRPVLIDIGANWCHWCHVMESETYGRSDVADLINENFIAVKVDRDERPDVDERYQSAYVLINRKAGGWPLTVFALPDGRAFESLTYVPGETKGDQIGMVDILKEVMKVHTERREDVLQQARLIENGLANSSKIVAREGAKAEDFVGAVWNEISRDFDVTNAGFGSTDAPKFPNGSALMFLLHYHSDVRSSQALDLVSKTLTSFSKSGLRDHVMGGFFRYTADGAMRRPHFEKMLYVQGELLSAYANAYAATHKSLFKEVGQAILMFTRETLERQGGGFYASQDADIVGEPEGAYYTWTREEIEKAGGSAADAAVFMDYLNVGEENRDAGGRSVLYSDRSLQTSADAAKVKYDDAQKALNAMRKRLHDLRMEQEKVPRVDKSIVASWNAMMISAYLDAYRYFGDAAARDFALESMDFVLNTMVSETEGVAHIFAREKTAVFGLLEDQVHVADALVDCFEVSSRKEYLQTAESMMNYVEAKFLDSASGLYVDRVSEENPGLLAVKRIPLFDNPIPSSNAVAAVVWYRLYQATQNEDYREKAERIAKTVAGNETLPGLAAAALGRAVNLINNGGPKVLVIGKPSAQDTSALKEAALAVFRMGKLVEVMNPDEAANTAYKPAEDGKAIAYVCTAKNCAPPVSDPGKIADVVKTFGLPSADRTSSATTNTSAERKKLF